MLKPAFVDFLLIAAFVVFSFKGLVTGSVRSAMTLIALALGWFFSALLPTVAGLAIGYLLPEGAPNYLLVNRLVSVVMFYAAFQTAGFLLTGLFENIHLGALDKFFGLLLGLSASLLIVSMPGAAIIETPRAYEHKPNQRYFAESKVIKAVRPVSTALARPVPRSRRAKTR